MMKRLQADRTLRSGLGCPPMRQEDSEEDHPCRAKRDEHRRRKTGRRRDRREKDVRRPRGDRVVPVDPAGVQDVEVPPAGIVLELPFLKRLGERGRKTGRRENSLLAFTALSSQLGALSIAKQQMIVPSAHPVCGP